MISFIDDHRAVHGVEPICRVLPIAPSTYHAPVARRADPANVPPRARRDAGLGRQIRRVFEENVGVDGVRKVWRQLGREGIEVARCTVARLMRAMALQGVVRGRAKRTTVSEKAAPCPLDRVNRNFGATRPNALWVADFSPCGVRGPHSPARRRHLGRLRPRRLGHRRLRQAHRRLAGLAQRPDRVRPRRARSGVARPAPDRR